MTDPPLPLTLPWWFAAAIVGIWLVAVSGVIRLTVHLVRRRSGSGRRRWSRVGQSYADLRTPALAPPRRELDP